ncbi:hypothetical protein ACOJQI_12420 [Bacillus salacetis]|uniref:hypothetical protein n=1 Tax=Bacillus salacetis TaxID=2315464 RepID=UPI003B9E60A5
MGSGFDIRIDCYFDFIDGFYLIILFRLIQSQSYFWLSSAKAGKMKTNVFGVVILQHLLQEITSLICNIHSKTPQIYN